MNRNEIETKLDEIIQAFNNTGTKGVESIKEVITDSLDLMRFIVTLEEKFDIFIDEELLVSDNIYDKAYVIGVIEKSMVSVS